MLAEHGLFLYHHHAVGDNLERIVQVLKQASERSNVVILTGGIGPTNDDLTRDAVAKHLGLPLTLDPEALAMVESFFRSRSRTMPEENRRQAMRIQGAEILPNPNGTAPGQYVAHEGVHYFLLPGPPLEMKPMLKNEVLPRLLRLFPSPQVLISRILHFCGIGESHVDEQLHDLMQSSNPTLAPLAGEGEMLLRITANAPSVGEAEGLVRAMESEIRRRLGSFIYGTDEDTLPVAAYRGLQACGATVAVAESCTGGMVNAMMAEVPGVSAVWKGGVVAYENAVKMEVLGVSPETLREHGAVSAETAKEMAEGVRQRLGSTYGLATTGIAGPNGGTPDKPVGLVYIAVAGPTGSVVERGLFRGSREQIRIRSSKNALWQLVKVLSQDAADHA